eukprot:14472378-Alexandrium_andersonii.AAC.1
MCIRDRGDGVLDADIAASEEAGDLHLKARNVKSARAHGSLKALRQQTINKRAPARQECRACAAAEPGKQVDLVNG